MIYGRSTPKYAAYIRDGEGNPIDPDNANVTQIRLIVFDSQTGKIFARRYYKGNAPSTSGLPDAGKEYVTTGISRQMGSDGAFLQFYLTTSETSTAGGCENTGIQVELDIVDSSAPGSTKIIITQGPFAPIKQSVR